MAKAKRIRGGKRGLAAAILVAGALSAGAITEGTVIIEGGYVDHASDPGGKTRWGITEAVARRWGYSGEMSALPIELAIEIYKSEYITDPGYQYFIDRCEGTELAIRFDGKTDKMIASSVKPSLGWELTDTGVNAGTGRASRWLQESLNAFNQRGRHYADISEDGDAGPATRQAFDALARRRGTAVTCEVLRRSVDAKQANHYFRLAARNVKFEDFTWGWVRTRVGKKENPL